MRSSDQRYFHVQRQKRDSREWEQWSKALILALRDVRTGQGDFAAVEAACRGAAAEWSHVLIATGRTANDFRRNFRLGSPNEHRVAVNDLAELSDLRAIGLDGFSALRLSKEQAKNVKLRWAKLHERDSLLHDPQGAHWSAILGMWIDGQRAEHIEALRGLYGAGNRLVTHYSQKDAEAEKARSNKEWERFVRTLPADVEAAKRIERERPGIRLRSKIMSQSDHYEFVEKHLRSAEALFKRYSKAVADERPDLRKKIEISICVVEQYIETGEYDEALFNPKTDGRHCADSRLLSRLELARLAMDEIAKSDFGKSA